jgi:hypothetical protein
VTISYGDIFSLIACHHRAVRTLISIVVLLASCKGTSTRPIANTGGVVTSVVPVGWIAIDPDDERLRCANYARDEWQVSVERGVLTFTESAKHEPDTGPALPFTPKQKPDVRGRRHVLAVSDGFLVGFDAGEWGGSLWWFSKDGAQETKLADENVHGLVAMGPDLVGSIEGLSHMSTSEGSVRWIERAGTWHAGALTALDAGPSTFVAAPDAIYVLTRNSLVRVGKDRKMVTIQPVRTASLYPDSMLIDAAGEIWIGMRQFVVRMTPVSDRYKETWLVRATCVRATVRDLDCVCSG